MSAAKHVLEILIATCLAIWWHKNLGHCDLWVQLAERRFGNLLPKVILLVAFCSVRVGSQLWACLLLVPLAPLFMAKVNLLRQFSLQKRLPVEFLAFLDRVVLQMKGGASLRRACEQSVSHGDADVQHQLEIVVQSIGLPPERQRESLGLAPSLVEHMLDIAQIAQQSHQVLRRVEVLRYRLRVEHDFRRRSGEAAVQVRIQCFITAGLYLALLAFVLMTQSVQEIGLLLLISCALFGVGVTWILLMGRRYRWKV